MTFNVCFSGKCRLELRSCSEEAGKHSYVKVTDILTGYVDKWFPKPGDYGALIDMSDCSIYNKTVWSADNYNAASEPPSKFLNVIAVEVNHKSRFGALYYIYEMGHDCPVPIFVQPTGSPDEDPALLTADCLDFSATLVGSYGTVVMSFND